MTPDPLLPLARLDDIPTPPAWFATALDTPYEALDVAMTDGRRIEARAWGPAGAPGLVLLHGNAAHLGWWTFLAPFFADRFRVTAFSLGGMGGSEWHDDYSVARFADEMWTVADAAGATAHTLPPVLVAHSMGGLPVIHAGAKVDRPIRAAVLIDVGLPGIDTGIAIPEYKGHRLYPSVEAALGRFRLAPPQPCANRWIAEYLGRMAVQPAHDAAGNAGWSWRFDPRLWGGVPADDVWLELAAMRCPVALIRGANSRLTAGEMIARMIAALPAGSPLIEIADADHHVMIDQPLALVAALDALFAGWVPGLGAKS
ncbi:alpha/beta fold hydrolase [Sphingomonas turrisvirgatae]|uniref:AB hydrolase-1 domain-containing protein n=1 Tax=Sphingomonas turrisvirgatae TaxID=1888892 RepID=A0A1E3LXE6_9SPHN|nr:alpha/beta hydrolase [Sphingomonas turrisvirgatae]ODP38441.1 hypothetical protein BFL28_13750 [Sphingomonas turrisvirgatae]